MSQVQSIKPRNRPNSHAKSTGQATKQATSQHTNPSASTELHIPYDYPQDPDVDQPPYRNVLSKSTYRYHTDPQMIDSQGDKWKPQ